MVHGFLILLLLDGLLNSCLVGEYFLIELLMLVLHICWVKFALLPDDLESPVHVPELKVRTSVWTYITILVYSGPEYYTLVKQIGHLLVFHY